jgi:hypothetical protein
MGSDPGSTGRMYVVLDMVRAKRMLAAKEGVLPGGPGRGGQSSSSLMGSVAQAEFVPQSSVEEATESVGTALDQYRANLPGHQVFHEKRKDVLAVRVEAHDRFCQSLGATHHECGVAIGIDLTVCSRASLRVQDNAEWIGSLGFPDIQGGVIGADGARPHEDGPFLSPPVVGEST